MRVLLDECVPRKLRQELPGHEVSTLRDMGWARLKNGPLLARAAGQFEAFITVDQNSTSNGFPFQAWRSSSCAQPATTSMPFDR
jgi:hypothetical protein